MKKPVRLNKGTLSFIETVIVITTRHEGSDTVEAVHILRDCVSTHGLIQIATVGDGAFIFGSFVSDFASSLIQAVSRAR